MVAGWQHEDDDGFLYFYDSIMDVSSWEHPLEPFWKHRLEQERRAIVREAEIEEMRQGVAAQAAGDKGERMARELKGKFIKADIVALEHEIHALREQVEVVNTGIDAERGKDTVEAINRKYQLQRQGERLKGELKELGKRMKQMLQALHDVLNRNAEGEDDIDEGASGMGGDAAREDPVTPEQVKAMCEYLDVNMFLEPDLIPIAKRALEAPLPPGWEERQGPDGEVEYVEKATGEVLEQHPSDEDFQRLVAQERERLQGRGIVLFADPWVKFVDREGVPYYFNFRTDEVAFERPVDAPTRAVVRIQARARGMLERERLERSGHKPRRLDAPRESAAKQRLLKDLHQRAMETMLAAEREKALAHKLQEDELRTQEEVRRRAEARAAEERVQEEKAALLAALRAQQEREAASALRLQAVFRGHMARGRVELPWQTRARLVSRLAGAWRAHAARGQRHPLLL